jgi:DNA invertase Pin-like site-specific DNA recombinase
MQDKGSRKAIIYAAKSSPDERGSIPDQLKKCRELAAAEGYEVVEDYSEENVSAYSDDRGPELAAALAHAARIGAALIVWHSDRLARGDGEKNRHLVEILLEAMHEGFTLRSVEDDRTFESVSSAAQMGDRNHEDSRRKGGAVKGGLARRRSEGKRVGGHSYAITWRRNDKDEKETVPDSAKAPVVVRIYAEYLAGRPLLQIARGLNADGIASSRGGKWHPHVIATVLTNPIYAGLIRDGDELIEGRHEAIIPRATWEEAQALRAAQAATHGRGRPATGQHLFRKGFMRCGECGEAMIPRSARNVDDTLYEVYRCHGRWLDPAACSMPPQRRQPIDAAVYSYFELVGLDLEATRTQMSESVERKLAEIRALLEAAEREAEAASARLARVKDDYVAGELNAAEWRELRADLEPEAQAAAAERQRLATQLAEVEAAPDLAGVESELLEQLARIRAAVAGEVSDAEGVEAVRAALLRLFDRFVLHRGVPERANLELVDEGCWIEPVISERAVAGYDEKLHPVLARKPLGKAENNCRQTFVLLNPVISPISA